MCRKLTKQEMNEAFCRLSERFDIFAPVLKKGEGTFTDIDVVRYDRVSSPDEIEWAAKSDYSFKEVLTPINETLFYYTEDQTTIPKGPEKDILIFLRACDRHAVKRLDQIYLDNRFGDFYYARIREKVKFAVMGCPETCDSGFCVSMGTNTTDEYDLYFSVKDDAAIVDVKDPALASLMPKGSPTEAAPEFVSENNEKVTLPRNLDPMAVKDLPLWKEYNSRCIACGRCTFACPTCTCFSMQDIHYGDNPKVGERRRVWASCEVDGYDEIAGGISFRREKADRMRYKVMHKIYDYEKRFGYPMCVGCGRCDDICPEYISYSALVNRLAKEVQG